MLRSKTYPLKKGTGSVNPTSSTPNPFLSSRGVQQPKVPLGAVCLAPSRYYMEKIRTKLGHTFILGKDKFPRQWVLVLNRIRMSNSWMVLVLVNGELRWEHEIDAVLWKRSE